MAHRLDPLLRPASVAALWQTVDYRGDWSLKNLIKGGFPGEIYAVNPKYDNLQGIRCFPSLADLPVAPELVILAVSDRWVESLLDQEKNYIKWVLNKCQGNKTKAARIMGIDRVSLWRKINRLGI